MHYILLTVFSFILGAIICRNFYFKDSIFSDVDIMLITRKIESLQTEHYYVALKVEWEYVLRTRDTNVDKMSKELQKVIDSVLEL